MGPTVWFDHWKFKPITALRSLAVKIAIVHQECAFSMKNRADDVWTLPLTNNQIKSQPKQALKLE